MKRFLKLFVIFGIMLTLFSSRQNLAIKESFFCKSRVPGRSSWAKPECLFLAHHSRIEAGIFLRVNGWDE